ncbi:hypothetical protein KI688_012222 [Linnemannia hyalina]|uniref:Uncharacterized protein n=1 Tax=Linnemannia hyalina TaxID=64524 RepID=A0A9P7XWZ3_9FUNG|nr:hypothetical protein KI688_012222 [Linnemannia hyalina]
MNVGSLTKIGLILVALVLAKGDHCCCVSAGLGLSRTLLGKTVMGKGEQYCHEQAEVQKEENPALALGDEEQRRKKKSGQARAPMVGAAAAGHGHSVREAESESGLCHEEERNPATLTVCSEGRAYAVNGDGCQVVAGGRAGNSP